MTKKEFGKKTWGATKSAIGLGVGFATAAVTEIICEAYAPAETAPVIRKVMYKVGTKGLSTVTGVLAADAVIEKMDKYETMVTKKEKSEEVKMEVIETEA